MLLIRQIDFFNSFFLAINFGISDHFPSIGGISEQRKDYQLDKDKIVKKIKERLSK